MRESRLLFIKLSSRSLVLAVVLATTLAAAVVLADTLVAAFDVVLATT